MAKVVIDANVIISAAFGGKPLDAVARALEDHEVFLSTAIRQELQGVFHRLSKKLSKENLSFLQNKIEQIIEQGKMIPVPKSVRLSRDPKDDLYLSLGCEAGADFLITGDKDLLSILQEDLKKNGMNCLILTPKAFLEKVL
jgi:uncharacterized protein